MNPNIKYFGIGLVVAALIASIAAGYVVMHHHSAGDSDVPSYGELAGNMMIPAFKTLLGSLPTLTNTSSPTSVKNLRNVCPNE